MRVYRIYRMKDSPRQQFRWAPHVSGSTAVKRKDYDEAGTVEAPNEYAVWQQLRESNTPLGVGDILEAETGDLLVCKYVGFEPAQWWTPPPAPEARPQTLEPVVENAV
jgi:hypothetical protein